MESNSKHKHIFKWSGVGLGMGQKVDPQDYCFLTKVVGMQNALIVSAAEPVLISERGEGKTIGGFFYDCNEEFADQIIRNRLAMNGGVIKTHMRILSKCMDNYIAMDSALLGRARGEFVDALQETCENMKNYAEVVREHQKAVGWFLNYPKAPSGLYFSVQGTGVSYVSSFNRGRNYDELRRELKWIEDRALDFAARNKRLPIIASGEREKKYFTAGLYDPLFQSTLLTTYKHLESMRVVS